MRIFVPRASRSCESRSLVAPDVTKNALCAMHKEEVTRYVIASCDTQGHGTPCLSSQWITGVTLRGSMCADIAMIPADLSTVLL